MIETSKNVYNRYDPKATKAMFDLSKRDSRTNDSKVLLKKASLDVRIHYSTIRAARDWNALPSKVINSKKTIDFKNKLENFWRKTVI